MSLAAGDQVRLEDGRSGSIVKITAKGATVAVALEQPHPSRPDRVVASIEELEIDKGKLEPWTLEHEASLQAAERVRALAERERIEKIRRAQVDSDAELETMVRKLAGS